MKRLGLALVITTLAGCYLLPTGLRPGTLQPVLPADTEAVFAYSYTTGFVPAEQAYTDTLTVLGDGSWSTSRRFSAGAKATAQGPTGELTRPVLQKLVDKAFVAPALSEPPFSELREEIPSQVSDAPTVVLTLRVKGGSRTVRTLGFKPASFEALEKVLLIQTTAIPLTTDVPTSSVSPTPSPLPSTLSGGVGA